MLQMKLRGVRQDHVGDAASQPSAALISTNRFVAPMTYLLPRTPISSARLKNPDKGKIKKKKIATLS